MGQQQLLLLVLGIVLVGLAVVVGISAFQENQRKTRQDLTMSRVMDIASQAMVWKQQPLAMGGGDNGNPRDFSDLTLAHIGITATGIQGRTPDSRQSEYIRFNEYACVKMAVNERVLSLLVLNSECEIDTWWASVQVTGPNVDDLVYSFRDGAAATNGQ